MKLNKLFFGAFIFILQFQNLHAQENFKEGYVISLSEDTLRGFIDYRNWESTPKTITFKETLLTNSRNYLPRHIKGFGVMNEQYESAVIEVELSSDKLNNLSFDSKPFIKSDSVFLQTIMKGKKSLSTYYILGKPLFYIQKEGNYELLVYKKYLKNGTNGGTLTAENNKFIGQLTLYLQDCSNIQEKLKNVKYERKSLEKLLLDYYNCIDSPPTFYQKAEKSITEMGILLGASMTTTSFSGLQYDYLTKIHYKPSYQPSFGLFLNFVLPKNLRKWSLNNELFFNYYSVKATYNYYKDADIFSKTDTRLSASYVKINNMVRYKYPIGNNFIFFNAGISNGYAFSMRTYKKEVSTFYNIIRTDEDQALEAPRKHEFCLNSGLGFAHKKYSLELRYERGNGISDYLSLKNVTNRVYVLFAFKFL